MIRRLIEAACADGAVVDASLVDLAEAHGLAPLLGARIAAGSLSADAPVCTRLERARRECAARNLAAEAIVAPFLDALGDGAVYLKGAALLRTIYRDPGARSMSDIDILVPDLNEAIATAGRLGGRVFWPFARPMLRLFTHELDVVFEDRVTVDVHAAVSPWPLFGSTDGLFGRAKRHVPSLADLFVTVAMHAAQDGFVVPARAVVDGILLARRVNQAEVEARAREFGARRATRRWISILAEYGLTGWGAGARNVWSPRSERSWTRAEMRRAKLGLATATTGLRFAAWAATRVGLRVADRIVTAC